MLPLILVGKMLRVMKMLIHKFAFEPQKDEPMKDKDNEQAEADRTTPMETVTP